MGRPRHPILIAGLALIATPSLALRAHGQETGSPPAAPEVAPNPAPAQPAIAIPAHDWKPGDPIDDADDLLVALETADADITTFEAGIRYTRVFALAGDEQIRDGMLYFETVDRGGPGVPALRRFAVQFKQLQVGARVETEEKHYIFDGEWFVEKLPGKEKLFIKRQVVPTGERFDPLRIGEGPFPVPIGQRRAEVLERYTARLLPPEEGLDQESLRKFVTSGDGAWHIALTPIATPQDADELTEIHVWYRKSDLLPRLVITTNLSGDQSTVQMINPEKNPAKLPYHVFDTAVPARGWNVRIEPYREAPGQP